MDQREIAGRNLPASTRRADISGLRLAVRQVSVISPGPRWRKSL